MPYLPRPSPWLASWATLGASWPPLQPNVVPPAASPDPATGSGALHPSSCAYTSPLSYFISLALSGLSCSTWSSLRHAGSVFATRELLLGREGSVVASCGCHCSTACGILIPQAGIRPVSLALQGGFLTTGPPGKPPDPLFFLLLLGPHRLLLSGPSP